MNQRKKRIDIIIGILFLWICLSVYIGYHNLNRFKNENLRLENAIKQFQNLDKIHNDINNITEDSLHLDKKDESLTRFQNHINQLLADTAELSKTKNDSVFQKQIDTLKEKFIQTSISKNLIENNETEFKKLIPSLREIKIYVKALKKKQLAGIDNTKTDLLSNSKIDDYEVILFRITFLIGIIILLLFLKNNVRVFENNTKKQIEEKNKELKEIIDGFFEPFFSLDNDWNISYMNDAAASHYTIPKYNLIGKNYWEVTPHLKNHQFYTELTSAKENAKAGVVELFYEPTKQWYENWIYPNQSGISVYYREITEKKKSEENIIKEKNEQRVINDRLLMIAGATNEAVWDWEMESGDVWGNENYFALIDKKDENESNYDAFVRKIHPDDVEKSFAVYEEGIKNKKEILINEYRFLNKNGEWIHLLNRQKYIYNEEGKPKRILGTLLDITFQKKILEQINFEKDLSDSLINSLPGLFYMFNKEQKLIRWNKNLELISGYSSEEIPNVHPVEFVPEEQRETVGNKIANVFLTGSDFVEADFYTKDKKRIPYYFTGVFVRYNNEDCMMGVGLDISEKIKVENELRQYSIQIQNIREEERTNMAREIHDELGQQLTGLKMNLSWIKKKIETNNVNEVTGKISDSIETIDNTIQSVRKIATELRPSILDDLGLIAALEWQTDEFKKRFHINASFFSNVTSADIKKELATSIFRVYQESLTNVLRHSKATQLNTVLEISNKELKLKITDNGIGFDMKEVKEKNTLGLLGMKERITLFAGSYEIISEINKGTTISIIVPIDA